MLSNGINLFDVIVIDPQSKHLSFRMLGLGPALFVWFDVAHLIRTSRVPFSMGLVGGLGMRYSVGCPSLERGCPSISMRIQQSSSLRGFVARVEEAGLICAISVPASMGLVD